MKDRKQQKAGKKILTLREMKEREEREAAERERVLKLMPRLRNWYLCYRSRNERNVSPMHHVMMRLLEIYGYPEDMPEAPSFGYREPLDQKDADKLEFVWSTMGAEWEADSFVDEKKRLTVRQAKVLIRLLVFDASKSFYFARRDVFNASVVRYHYLIHKSLLFFDLRLKLYEWSTSPDR